MLRRHLTLATASLAALTLLAGGVEQASARDTPVSVGEAAPAVTLPTLAGASQDLGEVYASGKTVVVVLRGYPGYQCGLCSRQASDFLAKSVKFANAGVQLVMIYPGEAAGLDGHADEFFGGQTVPASTTILLDPDYEFTDAYGLRWDAPNETAYPTTLVVENGEITWAKVSRTHGGRTKATEVLAAATR